MNTIAIDCGASFIKAAYIKEGKIVKRAKRQAPNNGDNDDFFTFVRMPILVQMVKSLICELSEKNEEIRLCIANEMHGFLLAYENGELFTDYISWQKEYGNITCKNGKPVDILSSEEYRMEIRKSGMPLRAGLPSSNLLYLLESNVLQQARATLYFYTLGDYLLRSLAGKNLGIHPTNAAASGLYDLENKVWNSRLITRCTDKYVFFQDVQESEFCFEFETRKIHAFPAIGDQQAALLGAGLKEEGTLSFNLGTGAQVSRLSKEICFSDDYQVRPFFDGNYIITIPHIPSGRAINVYVRFLKDVLSAFEVEYCEDDIWKVLLQEQEKNDKELLECELSFFENAVTNKTVGSIGNIQEFSMTLGNLADSVFTQMGINFVKVADKLVNNRNNVKRILLSGGIAKRINKISQYITEQYGSECEIIIATDETLLGLYYYGEILTKQ